VLFNKGKMMRNNDVISILNDLIETCKDGENGFLVCAQDVNDLKLKQFFTERAQSCASAAHQLQEQVRVCGGDPETSGSLTGTLHRRWVDITAAISGKSDEAILNECERGEDVAVRSYQRALEKELPADIAAIVERQYQGLLRNLDQVKLLREQARSRHSS
jgi:uncharacterized protein (TIGR02284 family)